MSFRKPAILFAATAVLQAQAGSSPSARLSAAQWREDVAYFGTQLAARHPNLFFHLPKPQFEQQIRALRDSANTASDLEMKAGLARIMAAVGDAHSWIDVFKASRQWEIRFREFPEGWYCIEARADIAEAVGAKLVSVAGVAVEEAVRRLTPFVTQENPMQREAGLAVLMTWPRALEAAGLPIRGDSADLEFIRDGRRFAVPVSSPARRAPGEWAQRRDIRRVPSGSSFQAPLYQSDPISFYWWRLLPSGTLYVQYNRCAEDRERPMKRFAEEVARTIAQKHPARIVVDLRNNGGGDSRVVQPLVEVLRKQKGRVFVTIGRGTGGSGAFAMVDLKNRAHAVRVGEPTAEKPNGFGEQRTFNLPNSRLQVTYATRFYRFLKDADPPAWEPDERVILTAADFVAGRDPVLEWVERR